MARKDARAEQWCADVSAFAVGKWHCTTGRRRRKSSRAELVSVLDAGGSLFVQDRTSLRAVEMAA